MRELRGEAVIAPKWVVVVVAVLAAGIPIGAVSGYAVGSHGVSSTSGHTVILNESVTLNGTRLGPSSNTTLIAISTSDVVNSFAVAFESPVSGDFCVMPEVLSSDSGDFGACVDYGKTVTNLSAGSVSIENIYDFALFGVYIPSGKATVVSYTWWANWTTGPVTGGAGNLFVPAGHGASQGSISFPVPGSPYAVAVYLNASGPVSVVATGALCCQRSLSAPTSDWAWVGGYYGSGIGVIEIAWSEATVVAVSVQVVAFY
ncbi:MAG: hypothetical protein WAN74_07835 [Thermoplasmata archaeon]